MIPSSRSLMMTNLAPISMPCGQEQYEILTVQKNQAPRNLTTQKWMITRYKSIYECFTGNTFLKQSLEKAGEAILGFTPKLVILIVELKFYNMFVVSFTV